MTFKSALLNARHHIIFLLGLMTAFGIVIQLERLKIQGNPISMPQIILSPDIPSAALAELSPQEMEWARTAWKYFQNNYQETTGLVNSVDGYTATTMWDTASYLLGLIAAQRLQIVDQQEFDRRLEKTLRTLAALPMFENALPNKSYNTQTLAMVDYTNKPVEGGIGWSAIDIGRVLVPLNIIVWNYPQHAPAVKAILARWDFKKLLRDGRLHGAAIDSQGQIQYLQEGRLGYEEYAAKTLALMGYDVLNALEYADFLKYVDIYGIQVPTDSRDPERYHAHNYVVSEPYILDGLEFGWDSRTREFAYRVFQAQEQRYRHEGVLTAVSEDNIDEPPYFVYNTVFTSGKAWNTITDKGEDASAFKSLSTKAALGWHVLYGTDYTAKLMERVQDLYDPARGWYSGWYEIKQRPNKAITANTNGIVLESLHYRRFGRLVAVSPDSTPPIDASSTKSHDQDSLQSDPARNLPAERLPGPSVPGEPGGDSGHGNLTEPDPAGTATEPLSAGSAKKGHREPGKTVGGTGKGAKGAKGKD